VFGSRVKAISFLTREDIYTCGIKRSSRIQDIWTSDLISSPIIPEKMNVVECF